MRLLRLSIAGALVAGIATFLVHALKRERERVGPGEAAAANGRSSIDDVPTLNPPEPIPQRAGANYTGGRDGQPSLDERVAPGAPL